MRQKHFKFQIKELTTEGTFTGMAAVYGNVDLGGDVIDPGAFTKTIADKGGEVPILWQHNPREPIGIGRVSDSKEGLAITGELVLDAPQAKTAYALMKKNVLRGLSIGYDTVSEKVTEKVRYLKELKLWEVSLVTFPMNERALVNGVKGAEEFDLLLSEIRDSAKADPQLLEKFKALAGELFPPAAQQKNDAPGYDVHAAMNSLREAMKWKK
jgi:HK97 family phage prohead protease